MCRLSAERRRMFTWACPTCGRELDVSTKECPQCAGKIPASPPTPIATPPPVAVPLTPGAGPLSQSRLLMAGIALLVIAIAFVAWAVLRNRNGERPPAVEKPAEAVAELPVTNPDIEIAGVRPFYNEKNQTQVRAIVINHGEEAVKDVQLKVALRPRRSAPGSPPLGRFTIKIPALKPESSQEITAPLDAFGTLTSFPRWRELRADVE